MKNILILEDDLTLATQWAKALGSSRYNVHITTDAEEALDLYSTEQIDLCIVDFLIHVEGKPSPNGGITFLGKMDPLERRKTKILGVTGMIENAMAVGADKLFYTFGAQEFMQKPFLDQELVARVEKMFSK